MYKSNFFKSQKTQSQTIYSDPSTEYITANTIHIQGRKNRRNQLRTRIILYWDFVDFFFISFTEMLLRVSYSFLSDEFRLKFVVGRPWWRVHWRICERQLLWPSVLCELPSCRNDNAARVTRVTAVKYPPWYSGVTQRCCVGIKRTSSFNFDVP